MLTYRNLTFGVAMFVITYCLFVYPFYVLAHLIIGSRIFDFQSIVFNMICFLVVLFYFRTYTTFKPLKFFVYEGMGLGFISFWTTNLALILGSILPLHSLFVGLVCSLTIITVVIYSSINGKQISITELEIFSSKINSETTVIFLSDMHLGSNSEKHLAAVCEKLEEMTFDLILIGGDLIDSSSFKLNNLLLLRNIKKPILFVKGNHEYYIKNHETKLNRFREYGLSVLTNGSFEFGDINIIGVDDNQDLYSQECVAKSLKNDARFNIVLVHKPSLWDKVSDEIDLMLSGHTHNGQIFPFNFFVRLRFKYVYGIYKNFDSMLYVSSGSGCWGPRMRLGSKNEIVRILIKPCDTLGESDSGCRAIQT